MSFIYYLQRQSIFLDKRKSTKDGPSLFYLYTHFTNISSVFIRASDIEWKVIIYNKTILLLVH